MASSIKYDVSFLVFILVILDVCLCCAVCFSILYFCFEAPNSAMMAYFFNWLYGMREKEEPWRVYSGDFFPIYGQSESLCFSVGMITMDSGDVPFIFILHDWEAENCICCFNCFSVHPYNSLRFLSLCLGESVRWPDICTFDRFLPTYLVWADINKFLLASIRNLSAICKYFPTNSRTLFSLFPAFQNKICSWWVCIILAFLLWCFKNFWR